jgi:hypothetical protein
MAKALHLAYIKYMSIKGVRRFWSRRPKTKRNRHKNRQTSPLNTLTPRRMHKQLHDLRKHTVLCYLCSPPSAINRNTVVHRLACMSVSSIPERYYLHNTYPPNPTPTHEEPVIWSDLSDLHMDGARSGISGRCSGLGCSRPDRSDEANINISVIHVETKRCSTSRFHGGHATIRPPSPTRKVCQSHCARLQSSAFPTNNACVSYIRGKIILLNITVSVLIKTDEKILIETESIIAREFSGYTIVTDAKTE